MKFLLTFVLFLACMPVPACAEEALPERISLFNGIFAPSTLTIPANRKIKLTIANNDLIAIDFTSAALDSDIPIRPQSEAYIYLGPLAPGRYAFFDALHRATSPGTLIVAPATPP